MSVYIIFVLLSCLLYGILLSWIRNYWLNKPSFEPGDSAAVDNAISIVIVARNEENYIAQCLDSIRNNDFPSEKLDIILIDDHSDDKTIETARRSAMPNLRIFRLVDAEPTPFGAEGKKAGQFVGIRHALHPFILCTDADCTVGAHWVSAFSALRDKYNPDFIAGPVCMSPEGSLINMFQHVEMMGTMAAAMAGIASGRYFSANGANMGFSAESYREYVSNLKHDIASGDDMFFVQEAAANGRKVMFLKDPRAIVQTETVNTFRDFVSQRIRWATKTSAYPNKATTGLMASLFLFHVSLVVHCLLTPWVPMLGIAGFTQLSTKIICDARLLMIVKPFFRSPVSRDDMSMLPMVHTLYLVMFGLLGLVRREFYWKGRRVA